MSIESTLREHFKLLRQSTHAAFADYHANVLYGYLMALRETKVTSAALNSRLHRLVTRAWRMRIDRIHGVRRVA